MPIRWQRASASSIMWVVRNSARLSWHLTSTSQICLRLSGSSPVEGSSKNTILGSPTKLIAIDSLRFIPPDKADERNFLKLVKLTSSMAYRTLLYSYLPEIPFRRA